MINNKKTSRMKPLFSFMLFLALIIMLLGITLFNIDNQSKWEYIAIHFMALSLILSLILNLILENEIK